MKEEFGGFLPLELKKGEELYKENNLYEIQRYNSGRTAIWAALQNMHISRLWVPHFYCPSVFEMLYGMGIEICKYHIDEEFKPIDVTDSASDGLILVNYYGILDKYIMSLNVDRKNLMIDNSQAFYTKPIIHEGIYNIYSCRKFFGVPDGAYLIGKKLKQSNLEQGTSYERMTALLKAIELGTNSAYKDSLRNEEALNEKKNYMSLLTKSLLQSIDYEEVAKIRLRNAAYVNDRLSKWQTIKNIDLSSVMYLYPLLVNKDIRSKLVSKKIYIPTLWKELITAEYEGTIEYRYSKYMLCLPIDQRYTVDDLEKMCTIVEEELESMN